MLRRFPSPPAAHLSVAVASRPIYAGDCVAAEIIIVPQYPITIAEGRLQLSQTELLRIDSARDALPPLHHSRRRSANPTLPPDSIECIFVSNAPLEAGVEYRYPAQLPVPAAAAPTVKGKHARIIWELEAQISVRADDAAGGGRGRRRWISLSRGPDAVCRQEVVVFARPDAAAVGGAVLPERPCVCRSHRSASIKLRMDASRVVNGGTLDGAVSVQARTALRARAVRVELVRWERSGTRQARVVADTQVLQRPVILPAGETADWPFRLRVPAPLLPSVLARHTFVGWQVRAVIVRRLLPNLDVVQLIQVYTAP